jgi:cell division protein ZapA (FtsZ GTPase activity inhibitor)
MSTQTSAGGSVGADEKRNITVQIFGSEYPIAGAKDPAYVQSLARYVDNQMKDIAKGSSLLSSGKVAILAALNMADELFILKARHEKLKEIISEKLSAIAKKIDSYLEKR